MSGLNLLLSLHVFKFFLLTLFHVFRNMALSKFQIWKARFICWRLQASCKSQGRILSKLDGRKLRHKSRLSSRNAIWTTQDLSSLFQQETIKGINLYLHCHPQYMGVCWGIYRYHIKLFTQNYLQTFFGAADRDHFMLWLGTISRKITCNRCWNNIKSSPPDCFYWIRTIVIWKYLYYSPFR